MYYKVLDNYVVAGCGAASITNKQGFMQLMLDGDIEEVSDHEFVLKRTKSYFTKAYKKFPKTCGGQGLYVRLAPLRKEENGTFTEKDFPQTMKLFPDI